VTVALDVFRRNIADFTPARCAPADTHCRDAPWGVSAAAKTADGEMGPVGCEAALAAWV